MDTVKTKQTYKHTYIIGALLIFRNKKTFFCCPNSFSLENSILEPYLTHYSFYIENPDIYCQLPSYCIEDNDFSTATYDIRYSFCFEKEKYIIYKILQGVKDI